MSDVPLRPTALPRKAATNSIIANPRNLRDGDLWENEKQMQDMVHSIRTVGLIQPLVVCTREGYLKAHPADEELVAAADFVILAGHRRHAACLEAPLDTVRIEVNDDQIPNMDLLMLEENLKRKELTVLQEAEGYRRIEAKGDSHATIAAKVGKSKSTITKRLAMLRLPDEAKRALLDKTLTIDNAYNLYTALGREEGGSLHLLLTANEILRSDRTQTAMDAVNRVLAGSARTEAEPSSATPSNTRQQTAPAAVAVLAEPVQGPTGVSQDDASVPHARTEPVLPEPESGSEDSEARELVPAAEAPPAGQPEHDGSPAEEVNEVRQHALAAARRNEYCKEHVAAYTNPVVDSHSSRVAEMAVRQASPAAIARAHKWLKEHDADAAGVGETSYRDMVLMLGEPALSRFAYAVALGEAENRASDRRRRIWDSRDVAYLQHLVDVGYEPTSWEKQHLSR
ncbi:hypothetical protein VO63_20140 [Streptomyces showdoensis]|uniref:ParB-like N-terminal domain-containing protein n=2 Tax=Streptomyces showdoensis TaxID=68268 RepID=A0A2P2GKQ6_STREW|nr:hypothetical protein VO63_20140 [Streptomyces showdoensis]